MPLELRLRIIDVKTGRVEVDRPSHSWTHVFGQLLGCACKGVNLVATVVDITNTGRSLTPSSQYIQINAPNGNVTMGIIVGTGNTAESINDYHLAAAVANGSGAGQLNYGNQTTVDPYNVSGTIYFLLQRTVTNNTGNTITVAEVGLYAYVGANSHCILRDVLGATVDITAGNAKLIQYVISAAN